MIYAGTSGYSFREWVGSFYPPKTPSKEYLGFYASRLNSVEINHTFRRFPSGKLLESWAAVTPPSFRFSVKMHQSVTHTARLKSVGDSLEDFLEALKPLGPRMGVVLFQLPPYFRANLERLERFLEELPAGKKYAVEFRHPSWEQAAVTDRLREAAVALCAAEVGIGEGRLVPTAPHAYVRLRKTPPYSDEEIRLVGGQLQVIADQVEEIYLYVKHDDAGLAPDAVRRIQALSSQGEEES
ncbi:MAG: DUF72 domain-containing protein [Acidobacteriota bacterium]